MRAAYAGPIENIVVVMLVQRSSASPLPASRACDDATAERPRPALPVSAFLARTFMICDSWYAAAPGERIANRLFACAAAPGGLTIGETTFTSFLQDGDYAFAPAAGLALEPNVFSRLDAVLGRRSAPSGRQLANWKLYFHDRSIVASMLRYVAENVADPDNVNLANYDECDYPPGPRGNPLASPTTTFLQDVAQGALPPFALIEPRYAGAEPLDDELLLLEIYLALRGSRYWARTLLIVTYDVAAAADYVTTERATAPGPSVPPTSSGFRFDRFGGRVPTMVVSAYVPPGSVLRPPAGSAPFDHTSIVKTVWECFGLGAAPDGRASVNERDSAAPSILAALGTAVVNVPLAEPALPHR
jgi:phospholipase C